MPQQKRNRGGAFGLASTKTTAGNAAFIVPGQLLQQYLQLGEQIKKNAVMIPFGNQTTWAGIGHTPVMGQKKRGRPALNQQATAVGL